jgi:hypothetical protein
LRKEGKGFYTEDAEYAEGTEKMKRRDFVADKRRNGMGEGRELVPAEGRGAPCQDGENRNFMLLGASKDKF